MILFCDLDGVVWLAHQPIAGSVAGLNRWQAKGHEVVFVTNNSFSRLAEQEGFLEEIGIAARGRVVSSATAAGSLVSSGENVLVVGGPGIEEAVLARGAKVITPDTFRHDAAERRLNDLDIAEVVDAVIVGFDRRFDYERLTIANSAVRAGARLIGTNHDPTYPTPDGPIPGGGSLVAAVGYASETKPIFAGKPNRPMFEVALDRASIISGRPIAKSEIVVIGDRLDSDGAFAEQAGVRFCHVRTGVNSLGAENVASYENLDEVISSLLLEHSG